MNIKELSIGDWVMYRNREWQVCSLYQFTGEVGLWRKDSQICENVADLTPIPLTPEIAERNGFEKYLKNGEAYKIKLAFSQHLLLFKVGDGCCWMFRLVLSLFEDFDIAKVEIKYVHQLQHALRLAGIEKEIEL